MHVSHSVMSDSLHLHGLQPSRLLCPWSSPNKNTGVDSYAFFQGIFPTQGLNPGFLHCRQILYYLSHQGSPGQYLARSKCSMNIIPYYCWIFFALVLNSLMFLPLMQMKNGVANTIGCRPIAVCLIFDDNSHLVFKWVYIAILNKAYISQLPLAAKL